MKTGLRSSLKKLSPSRATSLLTLQVAIPPTLGDMSADTSWHTCEKTREVGITNSPRCPNNTNKYTALIQQNESSMLEQAATEIIPIESADTAPTARNSVYRYLDLEELRAETEDIGTEQGTSTNPPISASAQQESILCQPHSSLPQIDVTGPVNEGNLANKAEDTVGESMSEETVGAINAATTTALVSKRRNRKQQLQDDYRDNELEYEYAALPLKKDACQNKTLTPRKRSTQRKQEPPNKKTAAGKASKRRVTKVGATQCNKSSPKSNAGDSSDVVRPLAKKRRRHSIAGTASTPSAFLSSPTRGKRTTKTHHVLLESMPIQNSRIDAFDHNESIEAICEYTSTSESTIVDDDDGRTSGIDCGDGDVRYTTPETIAAWAITELYRGCAAPTMREKYMVLDYTSSAPDSSKETWGLFPGPVPCAKKSFFEKERYQECDKDSYDRYQTQPIQVPQEVSDNFIAMQQSIYDWGFRDGMLQRLEEGPASGESSAF
ncbi:hypothetical protein BGX27_004142 [Mortierella sp. AM989]|nr:hypothetical protein BGX27_004142 [Mortierella sp. AM989]